MLEENKELKGQNLEKMVVRLVKDLGKVGKEAELKVIVERIDNCGRNMTQFNWDTGIGEDGNVYLFVYDYQE